MAAYLDSRTVSGSPIASFYVSLRTLLATPKRLPHLITLLLALLLPFEAKSRSSCSANRAVASEIQRLVPRVDSFTLSNGLRVFLAPRSGESSVSVRVAYDVGARDEADGRGGLAHFFEHMMFKGSAEMADGRHFSLVRDVGGRVGAATDFDTTQYWNTVPSASLPQILFAEADRMRGPRITAENLSNQRAAISEEGLGLANLPYAAAAADFLFELWAGTGYGHSPIGTPSELRAASVEEMKGFHEVYYAPANAVLVIAGGFEVTFAQRAVREFFEEIPRRPARESRARIKVNAQPVRQVREDPLAPFPVYAVIWHGVGATAEDVAGMRVLDDLLMGNPDARFDRAVNRRLALYGYSVPAVFRDVGLLNYVFAPRTFVGFDEIKRAIGAEIESLRSIGPDADELCRSVRRERAELLARLETNGGVAAVLAEGVVFQGDPRAFEQNLDALDALDPERIRALSERYLIDEYNTLEIVPAGAMKWIKPILEFLPEGVGASLEESLL